MGLLTRCYGCGEVIWFWQDIIDTKVGLIHNTRDCILDAWYKLRKQDSQSTRSPLILEALAGLNAEGL